MVLLLPSPPVIEAQLSFSSAVSGVLAWCGCLMRQHTATMLLLLALMGKPSVSISASDVVSCCGCRSMREHRAMMLLQQGLQEMETQLSFSSAVSAVVS